MSAGIVYTAEKVDEIAAVSLDTAEIDASGNLILTLKNGDKINAGLVKGRDGVDGDDGAASTVPGPAVYAPVGSIMMWPTLTSPSGWTLCNGGARARTGTYAALFAVLGTTYGAGDGSTTFNVPDFRGRVPVGYTSADSDFDTIGEVGGVKTFVHSHTLSDAGQAVLAMTAANPGIIGKRVTAATNWSADYSLPYTVNNSQLTGNLSATPLMGNTDQRTGLSTVQPYITMNYIIKN